MFLTDQGDKIGPAISIQIAHGYVNRPVAVIENLRNEHRPRPIAAQKFPVVAGLGRRERTTLFVSRGVGTIYVPVRVNCPPEVALLTLQPA